MNPPPVKTRGFRICRVGGIDVFVDYSWFVVFFLLAFSMAERYFPEAHKGYSRAQYWLMGAAVALLVFASILAHELAHSLVAAKKGVQVRSVRLFIFGGLAEGASEPEDGRAEFLVALAGPAASMLLGMAFLGAAVAAAGSAMWTASPPGPASGIAFGVALANFGLAVFNLMPGFPLDGGRILRAFLWDRWNDLPRATQAVGRVGGAFALSLIVFGVLQMVFARNYVFGLWFVFVGFFMRRAAGARGAFTVVKTALAGAPVRQVMKEDVVAADWLLSVQEFVDGYLNKYPFTDFPVLNRDELVGMVSLEDVRQVEERLRAFKQVRDVCVPVEQVVCLAPEDDLGKALDLMAGSGVDCMPVTEDGRFLGLVSRRDILDYFKPKSDVGTA